MRRRREIPPWMIRRVTSGMIQKIHCPPTSLAMQCLVKHPFIRGAVYISLPSPYLEAFQRNVHH